MKIPVTVYKCKLCGGVFNLAQARLSSGLIFAPCERCGTEVALREATCMGFQAIPYEKELGVIKANLKRLKAACFGPKKKCPNPPKYLYVKKRADAFNVYDFKTYCSQHDFIKSPFMFEKKSVDEGESTK